MSLNEYISDRDFYLEVRKGKVPDHSIVYKFGSIKAVGAALTPVTTAGQYRTPTTPIALEVVSDDNTNDVAAGTGAREVIIEGLSNTNGAWTFESQTIALNGTTAVAVPNSMLRVYRMYVSGSGSYATSTVPSHNSTITLRVSGVGETWQTIIPESSWGLSQSEIAVYTVENGYTAYVLTKKISVESTKNANIFMFVREDADVVTAPFTAMRVKQLERNLDTESVTQPKTSLLKIPGPADFGFMCNADTGTVDVSIDFEILLVKD